MSVPNTADDFFQLIRKSALIDEQRITAFETAHQHDGLLQQEPKRIAHAMVREGVLTWFHAEQFLLGKWRGFDLGKYRLLERVGIGGMGQVFLCEHKFMRKRVAIKVLPPAKAEDPVSLGRFYREARVASALDHPNIVRTFDIDQDGPHHFLVMEYVDGTSLLDIVKKHGPMNVVRACHYIRQAAIGLQYGHQSGVIHRDIKPGNIMVDREGAAKILDMGLARFYRDEKDQLTLKFDDKNVLGTADYVAPEQTRDSRNIDVRADIYGLGATLYFVLAGQPPFPEGTVAEKLIAHQTKKPRPIRDIRGEVPQGLAKVLDKMMAKDPAERYQTPQEVADALEIFTQTRIAAPPVEEMPKLSPAAQPDPTLAKKPLAPTPLREPVHARLADSALGRTPGPLPRIASLPTAAIDTAATIPLPPKKSTTPSLAPAAAKPTDSASVVDLLTPPIKPFITKSSSDVDISETRPLPSDPTPQGATRPSPSTEMTKPFTPDKPMPKLDYKIPGFDLSRLQRPRDVKVQTSDAGPAAQLSKTPSVPVPKPPVNIPKPQSLLPGSKDMPKPPVNLPGSKDMPKPPLLPGSKNTQKPPQLPGSKNAQKPPLLPGSKDLPKPPLPPLPPLSQLPGSKNTKLPGSKDQPLPGSKDQPKPLPGSKDALKSPSRDESKPAPAESTKPSPYAKPSSVWPPTPAYRPPDLMPFFAAPASPMKKPSAAHQLLRWLFMMIVAMLLGAGLGTGIWWFFLR